MLSSSGEYAGASARLAGENCLLVMKALILRRKQQASPTERTPKSTVLHGVTCDEAVAILNRLVAVHNHPRANFVAPLSPAGG
jgi:hypothetical protein